MLWILVPVWLAWFFAEFFQEKIGTSRGNAITNAVVILWGSIDCSRQTVRLMSERALDSTDIFLRFSLVIAIFLYGVLIVNLGIKGKNIVKYLGRVRVISYVFAMTVPVFYNAIPFSFKHILAALLFFPLYYYVIELFDRITPNPKVILEDLREKENLAHKHGQTTHTSVHPTYSHQQSHQHQTSHQQSSHNMHSTHDTQHHNPQHHSPQHPGYHNPPRHPPHYPR
jgi:hypothetical protein